jgi:hypothetical protein
VIEGINRALATSYYNMVYDISQTTKNESNYGYHKLIKNIYLSLSNLLRRDQLKLSPSVLRQLALGTPLSLIVLIGLCP